MPDLAYPSISACVARSKHLGAGILLFRVLFWHVWKMRKGRDPWVAKTAAEWAQDTGLSEGQVRDAIKHLTGAGLVTCNVRYFQRVKRTFLEPTQLAIRHICKLGNPALASGENGHLLPSISVEQQLDDVDPPANAGTEHEIENKETGEMASVADILAGKTSLPNKKAVKNTLEGTLYDMWRTGLAMHYTTVPEISVADKGKLKMLASKAGDKTIPLILGVCSDWTGFTELVEANTGYKKGIPAKPQIVFLMYQLPTAFEFLEKLQSKSKLTVAKKVTPPVQPIAPATNSVHDSAASAKAKPKPPSKAEMMALVADDDDGEPPS